MARIHCMHFCYISKIKHPSTVSSVVIECNWQGDCIASQLKLKAGYSSLQEENKSHDRLSVVPFTCNHYSTIKKFLQFKRLLVISYKWGKCTIPAVTFSLRTLVPLTTKLSDDNSFIVLIPYWVLKCPVTVTRLWLILDCARERGVASVE